MVGISEAFVQNEKQKKSQTAPHPCPKYQHLRDESRGEAREEQRKYRCEKGTYGEEPSW